jgi:hypothetical protein
MSVSLFADQVGNTFTGKFTESTIRSSQPSSKDTFDQQRPPRAANPAGLHPNRRQRSDRCSRARSRDTCRLRRVWPSVVSREKRDRSFAAPLHIWPPEPHAPDQSPRSNARNRATAQSSGRHPNPHQPSPLRVVSHFETPSSNGLGRAMTFRQVETDRWRPEKPPAIALESGQ